LFLNKESGRLSSTKAREGAPQWGRQSRDDRQRKAFPGLAQAQFDSLLPVFRDIDQATQQQADEVGGETGARRRKPAGGSQGQLPTMAAPLLSGLSSYKTSPPFDVLGPQGEMGRSKAKENLPKLSPLLDDTRVDVALLP
jgi:hypothetical protein